MAITQRMTPTVAAAPVVGAGISPDVVAAIVAAVHEFSGGAYTACSITAAQPDFCARETGTGRRGTWGLAGAMERTEPF